MLILVVLVEQLVELEQQEPLVVLKHQTEQLVLAELRVKQ
jgi:hypothetical protein